MGLNRTAKNWSHLKFTVPAGVEEGAAPPASLSADKRPLWWSIWCHAFRMVVLLMRFLG